jgi:hypothetical protein
MTNTTDNPDKGRRNAFGRAVESAVKHNAFGQPIAEAKTTAPTLSTITGFFTEGGRRVRAQFPAHMFSADMFSAASSVQEAGELRQIREAAARKIEPARTPAPRPAVAKSPRRTLWSQPATPAPILEADSGKAAKPRTLWTRTGA